MHQNYINASSMNDSGSVQRVIQRPEYGNNPPSNIGFTDFSLCIICYIMQLVILISVNIKLVIFFAFIIHLPLTFAVGWKTIQNISPDTALSDDSFGVSVSMYNKYAVIGAHKDDDDAYTAYDSGSAYIFELNEQTNVWTETAKLEPTDASTGDYFGFSVAIYDTYVVIGAYRDDDMGYESGSAYIFERNNQTNHWSQTAKLLANDGASNDYFGFSVSIYDKYVVIGAYGADHINGSSFGYYAGSVYIYEKISDIWTQTTKLATSVPGSISEYQFGFSVSIYGKYVAIGANEDVNKGSDSGSVYIFERNEQTATWTQTAKLLANDGSVGDRFGSKVSIYDKYVVIGAKNANPKGLDSGSAYIFKKDNQTNIWTQTAKLVASDGDGRDYFGNSVAIYDKTVVIGADGDDDKGSGSGSAYIYERNHETDIWTQIAKLTASDGASGDFFGCSVTMYRQHILIGAYGTDTGSVYHVQNIGPTAAPIPTEEPVPSVAPSQAPTPKTVSSVNPTQSPITTSKPLISPTRAPVNIGISSNNPSVVPTTSAPTETTTNSTIATLNPSLSPLMSADITLNDSKVTTIVVIVIGVILLCIAFGICMMCILKRRRRKKGYVAEDDEENKDKKEVEFALPETDTAQQQMIDGDGAIATNIASDSN